MTTVTEAAAAAKDTTDEAPYLEVENLTVRFKTEDGVVRAVDGVDFSVQRGRTLGIVGESGSGKSVTSLAILGLHNPKSATIGGRVSVGGTDVVGLSEARLRKMRGKDMSMIFQDPLTSLHPYYKIGTQIVEAYRIHHDVSKSDARKRAIEMLDRVGIPEPAKRVDQYPHEFSGGMRQRAMIAMSLVNNPDLIIADEPTTALDVTVQAQILELLADLQREFRSAIIMITHDLGVVSQVADDVLVMYGGRSVEYGSAAQVLRSPHHPYTWGLLNSVPTLYGSAEEDLNPISGNPPSLINIPSGCAFNPRCKYAMLGDGPCDKDVPQLAPVASDEGHLVSCHLPEGERITILNEEILTSSHLQSRSEETDGE
ncbi:dipeptide/oligopeptide/nickel ABC transporter ATP-binding protein [Actinorhabdospora filicis]|uniref:Dipeptide/oligopeptide/nickel ABC transporter ATP-binding protein n=1 Tax=Actinorhabdospora filicis TaxID=1785913 RepID=A0A9W6SSD9_9ACTN|nr:ABC transporter ATP-binding protein [Actinorhabdospora filicis]GLZ81090.1 dipeptide/oligopeptide/nickel ABC transporter ATP-binding protein [Actinorhabdospora filicis]